MDISGGFSALSLYQIILQSCISIPLLAVLFRGTITATLGSYTESWYFMRFPGVNVDSLGYEEVKCYCRLIC
jgi:hypothetical protein